MAHASAINTKDQFFALHAYTVCRQPKFMRTAYNHTYLWAERLAKANTPELHSYSTSAGEFGIDISIMTKSPANKQNNRVDPISRKGRGNKEAKDPAKHSHLYTDDNPETTLHGTGFKDAETARKTISLVSKRSLTYQWQTINTMYNRAKHHPNKTNGIEAAQAIFETWLKETYPTQKREQRAFKPLLSKKTVEAFLPLLAQTEGIDTTFAEMYVRLEARKRLANTLVDDKQPGEPDWDRARTDALAKLVPEDDQVADDKLWGVDGQPSWDHLSLIAWAWSPVSEYRLLKSIER